MAFNPCVVPVTKTEMSQVDPAAGEAANVPPDKETNPRPPEIAKIVPPHEPVTVRGIARSTPSGKLSTNVTPLSATFVFGLLMLKLNVLAPLSGMLAGLNDLVIDGGCATTSVAVAVPPLVELTGPLVLVTVPNCVPVTFTVCPKAAFAKMNTTRKIWA